MRFHCTDMVWVAINGVALTNRPRKGILASPALPIRSTSRPKRSWAKGSGFTCCLGCGYHFWSKHWFVRTMISVLNLVLLSPVDARVWMLTSLIPPRNMMEYDKVLNNADLQQFYSRDIVLVISNWNTVQARLVLLIRLRRKNDSGADG